LTSSLYFRLSFAAIVVLAVFLAATGAVLDNAFVASLRLSMRERMLGQLYLLLTAASLDDAGRLTMPLPTNLPEPQLALPDSGLYAFVAASGRNELLWQSPSLGSRAPPPPAPLQVGEKQWTEVRQADGRDYYLLGLGFQHATKTGVYPLDFYLMAELAPLHKQISLYRQRLWGGLGGIALLLLTTQVFLLRWGLRPLRRVTGELGAIEMGERDGIAGRYPREVRQLTDKINALLAQERARQTRYRNALADLAHSLKTPLAVLRGATDHPDTLAATVDEQAARMLRIVERQLQRAATSADAAAVSAISVRPLVDRLAASLGKVYRGKNVTVSNQVDARLHFRGDEADLMEIFGNLLDNAFKWCRGRVHVEGRGEGHKLVIGIHDDGPGIDAGNIERILQRGVRADESAPGHGIGLAVTADIVEAYQGQIRIGASFLGGTAVVVEFLR
jgi:two-component system sensor histidine kinase PhoQ